MVESSLVYLNDISKEEFNEINTVFMKDSSVYSYVHFSFSSLVTQGIFYNGILIGLLNLKAFFHNSLAISIALQKEYRNRGISKIAIQKMLETYGEKYNNIDLFIANVNPENSNAILAFQNMDLIQTHEFDEEMIEEGAEFFRIFYAKNPCRKLVKYDI